MANRVLLHSQKLFRATRFSSLYSTKVATLADEIIHHDKRLPMRKEMQPARKPFVKNMLLGKIDYEMLDYPESQDTERNIAFFKWLKPVEEYINTLDAKSIDKNKAIPDEVFDKLNELGVFAAFIREEYGGLSFLESEYMKLIETLARIPAVALFFVKLNRCVDLLNRYGTEKQKLYYLPKIANGTVIPTCCITEPKDDDPKKIRASAVVCADNMCVLNGNKIFVPYANKANLFLVFCLCSHSINEYSYDKILSVILIDKSEKNIEISPPIETIGVRGLPHHNVTLRDVVIPKENIMGKIGDGKQMYSDFFTVRRHDIGAVSIGILKHFIENLTHHVTWTKHLNKLLSEYDSAREVLGKTCQSLYAMESATYLTSALIDIYKNQDCAVESVIVQTYCSQECAKQISNGIHLIGTPAYLAENIYDLHFRDAHALTVFESSIIDSETLAALLSLQYVGKHFQEVVTKLRNPFNYPWFNLFGGEKYLNLRIGDYLHPSLVEPARKLEVMMFIAESITQEIFKKHGEEIASKHIELRRFYKVISTCFVYCSVLSRASRAYCIGLRNSDEDMKIAHLLSYKMTEIIKNIREDLKLGEWRNGDIIYQDVIEKTLSNRGYFAEHPLMRNY